MLDHFHLASGARGWDYDIAPGMYTDYSNTARYIYDMKKKVLRIIRKESRKIPISHRVVDQLSPHHDSQFSAFSTEVLIRMNQGTITVVLPVPP